MIGFNFTPDWLRKWREFLWPVRERTQAKPNQHNITFDTQLKTALFYILSLSYETDFSIGFPIGFPIGARQ